MSVVYGDKSETIIYETKKCRKVVNHVLLGTILLIVEESGDLYKVKTQGAGKGGWVRKEDVATEPAFKIFFVDVGQGDGAIVESPQGMILVDGGPNKNFYRFMCHRYQHLLKEDKVEIEAMVVSHPDWDHFNGLTNVLKDERFIVRNIYHNGIIRYDEKTRSTAGTSKLGKIIEKKKNGRSYKVVSESMNDEADIRRLVVGKKLMASFETFWKEALKRKQNGSLRQIKRLTVKDSYLPGFKTTGVKGKLSIQVLAPIPFSSKHGNVEYLAFPDAKDIDKKNPSISDSHTINGHSIVLKLIYGKHSVLLGGDLNIPAELYLLDYYEKKGTNPFRVDVAKSCHHGSSDYLVDYLKQVKPMANVFSSGDNKSFDHPMADALGATARHTSDVEHPLMFSTELARASSSKGIHFGLINLRSNGEVLTMAQMKEQKRRADVWDSFTLPWKGKYHEELKNRQFP